MLFDGAAATSQPAYVHAFGFIPPVGIASSFIALSHASASESKWRPPSGQSAADAYLPHV